MFRYWHSRNYHAPSSSARINGRSYPTCVNQAPSSKTPTLSCYREEYYLSRSEPSMDDTIKYAKWQEDMGRVHNVAEVMVAKHRNGPIGNIKLRFDANLTQFDNLAEGYSSNQ
jgi:hypothetical protein